SARVLVLHAPFEDVCDRLESAMRMIGRTFRLAGLERHRTHAIEQQEGIDVVEHRRGKRTMHEKPLTFERCDGVNDTIDRTVCHVTSRYPKQRRIPASDGALC